MLIGVYCDNATNGFLSVQQASLGPDCEWGNGQQPQPGSTIEPGGGALWSVATYGGASLASAQVTLTNEDGASALISFENGPNGASCAVTTSGPIWDQVVPASDTPPDQAQYSVLFSSV